MIEKEMIVQSSDVQSVVESGHHCRIHLILEQDGVAHDHCAFFCLSERGPCPKSHERRHGPSIHGNFYVSAGPAYFINVFLFTEPALESRNLVDLHGVERGGCEPDLCAADRANQKECFHFMLLVLPQRTVEAEPQHLWSSIFRPSLPFRRLLNVCRASCR